MNKEYVQQFAKLERTHWWFVVRKKIILQFLEKYTGTQPLSILNIGAAAGASTEWLAALGNVVSLETEPFFIEHLKEKQLKVVESSVTNMPFPNDSFDLICAFDVIEHVDDDAIALKEMKRLCKPGGIICITVPALKILWSDHDTVNEHYRRYTKRSLHYLGDAFPALKKMEIRYFNSLLFVPILAARKISGAFRGDPNKLRSDFTRYKTTGLLNKLFRAVFATEIPLLKFIRFPFGVSLIAVWKKTGTNK
ncbi:MAG: class I SAM-dependent methyltransferase [Ferruginibacter sp.]